MLDADRQLFDAGRDSWKPDMDVLDFNVCAGGAMQWDPAAEQQSTMPDLHVS